MAYQKLIIKKKVIMYMKIYVKNVDWRDTNNILYILFMEITKNQFFALLF